ncbi:hypothetical protein BDV32DRAFT_133761 [Aspergillus pseudonomiae]|uniref:Uncharacterized protein n=1 Tax=Aspergillus pseudonomiae TaxID=1506151 RepID=A0A5N6HLR8_9EURO|nr:uncharacterized protein BDV37DRAFT_65739 [Aspergillus pseudonomiae]KAB8253633.1 hypothetical protein BDV32DRAFT_133761 [Aspergillus pseudonomiae]KAE8397184.1 hypothetical protein BDV37DRAFT_65739 [Aspergillus pseudonomiae]
MRPPEMSHSPAYYQDQDHRVTAYLHDSTPAPAAAHLPPEPPSLPNPRHDLRHPELNSGENTIPNAYPPDSWDNTYSRHPHRHSQQAHKPPHRQPPVESIYPDPEVSAVAPMTGGAARKEERGRRSWTDHSSYMSSDNHHLGVTRLQKRAIHTEEPLADDSQDALLMLFRLSIPVPIFSLCASLYTVFGLLFVLLVSPFRICPCIPYLRSTSLREQLCHLLVPQLHIHERLVRLRGPATRSVYNDADGSSVSDPSEHYSIFGLIAVLLLSSLLSIAFLLLVWTAAFFWVFAMVLGNPDGTERKDDGRAAVLGVCRWWQIWLRKARKPPRE